MTKGRIVILSSNRKKAFDSLSMPDGSVALVLNRRVHEKALRAADSKIGKILNQIKRGARTSGAGRAA